MAKKSDHQSNRTRIDEYLPEVNRSELNVTLSEGSLNRHLTKDNTVHVTGYVGNANSSATNPLRIKETDPHISAFQLEPVMSTTIGVEQQVLTQASFLSQLELMGIDVNRLPTWGSTTQFNWLPPVNIDMLINYFDYYWQGNGGTSSIPQYFTIESVCNKAKSRVDSYTAIIAPRPSVIHITEVDIVANTLKMNLEVDDIFTPGYKFRITNTTNRNFTDVVWTVLNSTAEAGITTVTIVEPIAIKNTVQPSSARIGRWWYNPTTLATSLWDGTLWVTTTTSVSMDATLTYQLEVYNSEVSCACAGTTFGWDQAPWDDNQVGTTLWSTSTLDAITFPTEADWILANGSPTLDDRWYNVLTDELFVWNASNAWQVAVTGFSLVISQITGTTAWDSSTNCPPQNPSPWFDQNHWIHKSQITTNVGIKRAAVPILEYNSKAELNSWVKNTYDWKYRADISQEFSSSPTSPQRIELDPVKNFTATHTAQGWTFYLYDISQSTPRGIDYTETFAPGYIFRVTDDNGITHVCTVAYSQFKEPSPTDPVATQGSAFNTVVIIQETDYLGPTVGGGVDHTRIEPLTTANGDPWRGYTVHWSVDLNNTSTIPSTSQTAAYDNSTVVPTVSTTLLGEEYVYASYQEVVLSAPATIIPLAPSLTYDSLDPSKPYPVAGGTQVRVYVNGVRQYGNYTENVSSTPSDYVVVGNVAYPSPLSSPIDYVTGITFATSIPAFSKVRIDVGVPARSDLGVGLVPVRTIENESDFILALASQQQPIMMSLPTYNIVEQQKRSINQYPLFNIYDIVTGEVVKASPILSYQESADSPINPATQTRIKTDDAGREFFFDQSLLDGAFIRAYRLTDASKFLWYSKRNNEVKIWDGHAYDTTWLSQSSTGVKYRETVRASIIEPVELLNVMGAVWFDVTHSILYTREAILQQWIPVSNLPIKILDVDPLLQTIWRKGNNNEQYVPKLVDSNGIETTSSNPTSNWEMLHQWYFNVEHDNKQTVSLSQLVSHFASILAAQPPVPALQGGGAYSYNQSQLNAGLGGLIKEHNHSFDLLISSVNNTYSTPAKIIEFARDQYESLLQAATYSSQNLLPVSISTSTPTTSADVYEALASAVIQQQEQNNFNQSLYGDSTSYDSLSSTGIRNWIATAPVLGFFPAVKPELLHSNNYTELIHHDGHRSVLMLTLSQRDTISRNIVAAKDLVGDTNGSISTNSPPSTFPALQSAFSSSDLLVGKTWYDTTTRTLYQLQALDITTTAPTITPTMVDGIKYFNTLLNQTFVLSTGVWIPSIDPPGSIDSLWQPIDISLMIGNVLLNIETKLYQSAIKSTLKQVEFSVSPADFAVKEQYKYARFTAYTTDNNISTPFVNSQFNLTDAFTWNYAFSNLTLPPRTGVVSVPMLSSWQALYQFWFNTPAPHLEPWKLQGYTDKPSWWDDEYLDTTGNRRWIYNHSTLTGMWSNILNGTIPSGRELPLAVVPTYSYVPVNIDDVPTAPVGGINSDELLPPYFNTSTSFAAIDVRSLYDTYNTQIVAPESDYAYGTVGPVEWQWLNSTQYLYDRLIISFLLEPAKFLHNTFGPDYVYVDGLNIALDEQQVYSHQNIKFHGDPVNSTTNAVANGLNQWYVNYNRYTGRNTGSSFDYLWTEWTPLLGYQTSGIADTSTFSIFNKFFDITSQDYDVVLSKDGRVKDLWIDAFNVSLLSIPPSIIQFNNQHSWKMSISSLSPISRSIPVHKPKKYPFVVTPNTTLARAFEYPTVSISPAGNWLAVDNDNTSVFIPGSVVELTASSNNNGTYTVRSSMYDPSLNITKITLEEPFVDTSLGILIPPHPSLPWNTGDAVIVTSTKTLPQPLLAYAPYYIIADTPTTFRLAETFNDAMLGNSIDFVTPGIGIMYVGEVASTFQVYGGASTSQEQWIHYAVDKTQVEHISLPLTISGIQRLIEIVDGYESYQRGLGIVYGSGDTGEYDPVTGRLIGWQSEIERFIDWAYSVRKTNIRVSDKYEVQVTNVGTDEFTFVSDSPPWITGQPIHISTTGSLPNNLLTNTEYYFVRTGPNTFKLSLYSSTSAYSIIDVTSGGSGAIFISLPTTYRAYPTFEINPNRNQAVIDTPTGILASVISTEHSDFRINQTLFDQYGRPLTADKLLVYRRDLQSKISILPLLPNDVVPQIAGIEDPYNYLHIGGGHLFIDKYQHILVFNNNTISGSYIYDPFVGLNVKRFYLDYYESENLTLRPSLGGHFLEGTQFFRNIEGSISDIQTYYSAYDQTTQGSTTLHAKALLDYEGRSSYLDALNVNTNSQFAFYRGMIQTKGSRASVSAYINSRRFVDAKIDEFWAYKLGEFGDIRPRYYPEIKLTTSDSILGDIQLLFAANDEEVESLDNLPFVEAGFEIVPPKSQDRYYRQPEQNTNLFMTVDVHNLINIFVSNDPPVSTATAKLSDILWVDLSTTTTNSYDSLLDLWAPIVSSRVTIVGTDIRIVTQTPADAVRIQLQHPTIVNNIDVYDSKILNDADGVFERISSDVISININHLFDGHLIIDVMLRVFELTPSPVKNNVGRLIDVKSQTTDALIPLWDPARGIHSPTAIHNVDVLGDDPAYYGNTLTPITSNRQWTTEELNTVWVDNTQMSYTPYYDDKVYPNVRDRLHNWGKLSDWASVNSYEWTESPKHPDQWSNMVSANVTLPNGNTASGTAKKSVFSKSRPGIIGVTIDGTTEKMRTPPNTVQSGDVIIVTTPTPVGIVPNVEFVVDTVDNSNVLYQQITLVDNIDSLSVDLSVSSSGLTIVRGWNHYDWVKNVILVERIYPAMLLSTPITLPAAITVFSLSSSIGWVEGDIVDVYINGLFREVATVTNALTVSITGVINLADKIEIVRDVHTVTDEERQISQSTDDGTTNVIWTDDYEYSTSTQIINGVSTPMYYFWVLGGLTRDSSIRNNISSLDVMSQLTTIPGPYMVYQRPLDDPNLSLSNLYGYGNSLFGSTYSLPDVAEILTDIPVYYRGVVIRNLSNLITSDNRFIIQFTRDETLRYHTETSKGKMDLKSKHEEWLMIRPAQQSTIPRSLWDSAVESMIGHKIDNPIIRVPSLDRELYDATFLTDTRFGLGSGQSFVDKNLALSTVMAFLKNPDKNFYPIDVDTFLNTHTFDTSENIQSSMNDIYTTFGTSVVNELWFELLADAMTTKSKHSEIMKTSWLALHGVRLLDVNGSFDD